MDVIRLIICMGFVAILCVILQKTGNEYSLLLQCATVIISTVYVLYNIFDFKSYIQDVMSSVGLDPDTTKILFKALCISVISDFTASFCSDSGYSSLSKAVELIGKTAVLVLSFPILKKLFEIVTEFIK